MFGKVVGSTFLSLLVGLATQPVVAKSQDETAKVVATQQSTESALPSVEVRSELAQQLLELALADVHPAFNELWLALHKSHTTDEQAALYAQTYALLKQFRSQWHTLDWDSRERLNLEKIKLSTASSLQKPYWSALAAGSLADEVLKMRPDFREYEAMRGQLSVLLDMAREGKWPRTIPSSSFTLVRMILLWLR